MIPLCVSSPLLALHFPPHASEIAALRNLVHQLVDLCQRNQQEIRNLRDEVTKPRTRLATPLSPRPLPTAPQSRPIRPRVTFRGLTLQSHAADARDV